LTSRPALATAGAVPSPTDKPEPPPPEKASSAERESRLAKALRANLRRRKAAGKPDCDESSDR
jgi:hypothetical protein